MPSRSRPQTTIPQLSPPVEAGGSRPTTMRAKSSPGRGGDARRVVEAGLCQVLSPLRQRFALPPPRPGRISRAFSSISRVHSAPSKSSSSRPSSSWRPRRVPPNISRIAALKSAGRWGFSALRPLVWAQRGRARIRRSSRHRLGRGGDDACAAARRGEGRASDCPRWRRHWAIWRARRTRRNGAGGRAICRAARRGRRGPARPRGRGGGRGSAIQRGRSSQRATARGRSRPRP